jgi:lipoprotein signal peptidase
MNETATSALPTEGPAIETPSPIKSRRFIRFHFVALTALASFGIDIITKHLAVSHLIEGQRTSFGPLPLKLVYNAGNAVNPTAAPISHVILTHAVVLVLVIAWLKIFKSRLAAVASGLCLGGLFGNFASLALPPHVVPDFIPVATKICNFADISLFSGIFLISCSLSYTVLLLYRSTTTPAATSKP